MMAHALKGFTDRTLQGKAGYSGGRMILLLGIGSAFYQCAHAMLV
jgi:hypothetical protein